MNNSTSVRADGNVGHRPTGRHGGAAEHTWALEPERPGSELQMGSY